MHIAAIFFNLDVSKLFLGNSSCSVEKQRQEILTGFGGGAVLTGIRDRHRGARGKRERKTQRGGQTDRECVNRYIWPTAHKLKSSTNMSSKLMAELSLDS